MKKYVNENEEVICDFLVTKERKKLWNIELNMLEEIIRVCDKYNIKYWLTAGSMLGAVRHKGFIPWDDDIDIGMLRDDYDKFLEIGSKEFKYPLFLQSPYSDNIYRGHAQLRNSETTMMLPGEEKLSFNQGIFIDIFPYDVVPNDKKEYLKEKNKLADMQKIMSWKMENNSKGVKYVIKFILSSIFFLFYPYKKYYRKYEKICGKYKDVDGLISDLSFKFDRPKYQHSKNLFDEMIEVPFEGLLVKIPKEYDKILSKQYGDYMVFVKGTQTHGEKVFIDVDNSYKKYIGKDVFNEKI